MPVCHHNHHNDYHEDLDFNHSHHDNYHEDLMLIAMIVFMMGCYGNHDGLKLKRM